MVNLDEFKYSGTNLTAFRLLDPGKNKTFVLGVMMKAQVILHFYD